MTLTVLNIAYSLAPVHSAAAGGAEQVLGWIDSALTEAGHTSIVVACRGSSVRGTLVEGAGLPERIDAKARSRAYEQHRQAIETALARWKIDVIHMHGLDFSEYMPEAGPPLIVTLHLPLQWYPPEALMTERPGTYLHCVSADQEKTRPPGVRFLPAVPNGVPLRNFTFRKEKRDFVLCLGRICPEKGVHLAMDAAEAAKMPIFIAGEVFGYESHLQYFRLHVEPRLNESTRVFLGPIDTAKKSCLLGEARCLLVPSLAPETSSLVAMESLACGTPVVAFPSGALPEIIEDGKTGFIVNSVQEMTEAIAEAGRIAPENCRRAAVNRFSAARMIKDYFRLYELVKTGGLDLPSREEEREEQRQWRAAGGFDLRVQSDAE